MQPAGLVTSTRASLIYRSHGFSNEFLKTADRSILNVSEKNIPSCAAILFLIQKSALNAIQKELEAAQESLPFQQLQQLSNSYNNLDYNNLDGDPDNIARIILMFSRIGMLRSTLQGFDPGLFFDAFERIRATYAENRKYIKAMSALNMEEPLQNALNSIFQNVPKPIGRDTMDIAEFLRTVAKAQNSEPFQTALIREYEQAQGRTNIEIAQKICKLLIEHNIITKEGKGALVAQLSRISSTIDWLFNFHRQLKIAQDTVALSKLSQELELLYLKPIAPLGDNLQQWLAVDGRDVHRSICKVLGFLIRGEAITLNYQAAAEALRRYFADNSISNEKKIAVAHQVLTISKSNEPLVNGFLEMLSSAEAEESSQPAYNTFISIAVKNDEEFDRIYNEISSGNTGIISQASADDLIKYQYTLAVHKTRVFLENIRGALQRSVPQNIPGAPEDIRNIREVLERVILENIEGAPANITAVEAALAQRSQALSPNHVKEALHSLGQNRVITGISGVVGSGLAVTALTLMFSNSFDALFAFLPPIVPQVVVILAITVVAAYFLYQFHRGASHEELPIPADIATAGVIY